MTLSEKIRKDMLDAVKAKDVVKIDILKMVIASLKNAELEKGKELDEKEQESILRKEAKKLKDAYEEYVKAGREDLAQKEKDQLNILEAYLPKLMSDSEIKSFVIKKVEEMDAQGSKDTGKVMGIVMKELHGKADGTLVNNIVKEVLNEI